ncbi:hypothetical protein J7K27_05905 [Candidatus Bathyarchaeota archaeon]|nr:hypothetical protein [Candidatus Bathyarchaeota archaeon]
MSLVPKPELFTVYGETDGSSTTGTVSLNSDLFHSSVSYIRIPKGLKAKIWFKKVSGEGETLFTIQYTHDVTAASPTWINVEQEKLASKGEIIIEKRRPVILRGFTGKEAFRVTWTQPSGSAVKAYVELGVELG